MWVKPAGLGLEEIQADDLALMDYDGRQLDGRHRLHNEMPIHNEIYRRRPDVQAVVHTHPFYAAALSASGARFEMVSQDSLPFAEGLGVYPQRRAGDDRRAGPGGRRRAGRAPRRADEEPRHRRGGRLDRASGGVGGVAGAELPPPARRDPARAAGAVAADEVTRMYDRFERGYAGRNEAIWRYLVRKLQRAGRG